MSILAGCSSNGGDSGSASSDASFKIGTIGPLTGANASYGKSVTQGVELGCKDFSTKELPLASKAEDDQADPKTATTVAQRLVDAGVKGVIVHVTSGAAIPASRIYEQAGIPAITPSSTSPKLTRQGYKTTYRVIANDTQQGSAMAKFATGVLKAQRIAVIDDRTAYGQGLADALVDSLKQLGIKLPHSQPTAFA